MRAHIEQILAHFDHSQTRRWAKRTALSTATAGLLTFGQGACPTATPASKDLAPSTMVEPLPLDPDIHSEYAVDPDWKRQAQPAYGINEVGLQQRGTGVLASPTSTHVPGSATEPTKVVPAEAVAPSASSPVTPARKQP